MRNATGLYFKLNWCLLSFQSTTGKAPHAARDIVQVIDVISMKWKRPIDEKAAAGKNETEQQQAQEAS